MVCFCVMYNTSIVFLSAVLKICMVLKSGIDSVCVYTRVHSVCSLHPGHTVAHVILFSFLLIK